MAEILNQYANQADKKDELVNNFDQALMNAKNHLLQTVIFPNELKKQALIQKEIELGTSSPGS